MSDPLEMARCAEINLENLFSAAPFLKSHPIGVLLKMQISECVAGLEAAEHRVHPTDLRVRKRRPKGETTRENLRFVLDNNDCNSDNTVV